MKIHTFLILVGLLGFVACSSDGSTDHGTDSFEDAGHTGTDTLAVDDTETELSTSTFEISEDTEKETDTVEITDNTPATSELRLVQLISGGFGHTCAIDVDGELFCWGANQLGQAGNGKKMPYKNVLIPTRVIEPGPWKTVTCGTYHTCGIKEDDGSLWCFGGSGQGQIGSGDKKDHPIPVQIGTDSWRDISAHNFEHSCGIKTDGTLWCWGDNTQGQLGIGTFGNADESAPQQVGEATNWSSVTTGGAHVCAIRDDGELWCWGVNANGRLGIGDLDPDVEIPFEATPQKVGDDFQFVTAGGGMTCAIKVDQTLHCWGMNNLGQIGIGADAVNMDQVTPQQVGNETWQTVSGGGSHLCAINSKGTAHCWGVDEYGQLGQGLNGGMPLYDPAPVGDSTWQSLSVGGDHSCAVSINGNPYCWGLNFKGQAGIGVANASPITEPTPVLTKD